LKRSLIRDCHLLPVRPKQWQGEPIPSWLLRISHANGCSLRTLLYHLGFRTVDVLAGGHPRGLDLEDLSPDLLEALHVAVGALPNSSKTPKSWVGSAVWLFELPIKQERDNRTQFRSPCKCLSTQSQYCPSCLAEYDFSHSFQWKLSFCTVCPTHQRILRSSCPHCFCGVDFRVTSHQASKTESFRFCTNCKQDLCLEEATLGSLSNEQIGCLIRHQALNVALLNRRFQSDRSPSQVYSDAVESLIRIFCRWQIRLPVSFMPFMRWSAYQAGIDLIYPHAKSMTSDASLQIRSAPERARVMLMVASILNRQNFDTACADLKELEVLLKSRKLLNKKGKLASPGICVYDSSIWQWSAAIPRRCLQLQTARDVLPLNRRGHNRSALSKRLSVLTTAARKVEKLLADRDPYERDENDNGYRSRQVLWDSLAIHKI